MNTELNTLALAYAETLVEFYSLQTHCMTSELREDHAALRTARDNMYTAQNALDAEALLESFKR